MKPSRAAACLALAWMAGCAGYGPGHLRAGEPAAEVLAELGPPTGRYTRPEGGERLEFARGPFGKHTFMVDLSTDGKVQRWEQVLREDVFFQIAPGMRSDELRYRLGRPSRVNGIWRGATVWSWRYESPFCQWFQVTVEPDGTVRDAGFGPDPLCEVNDKDLIK
ncbi:MAG TPA: hypothetical protein VGQ91_10250 [Ideonella sp.]|jgi:hypothetical protein|nr:hypothetical protein [Ideonella sp.]